LENDIGVKYEDIFHASCKEGEKPFNLNITLGKNIGRHYPNSILKTPNLDIMILGEHEFAKS
jgi:hypothetical protein